MIKAEYGCWARVDDEGVEGSGEGVVGESLSSTVPLPGAREVCRDLVGGGVRGVIVFRLDPDELLRKEGEGVGIRRAARCTLLTFFVPPVKGGVDKEGVRA